MVKKTQVYKFLFLTYSTPPNSEPGLAFITNPIDKNDDANKTAEKHTAKIFLLQIFFLKN
jgi:hypothetical protein